MNALERGFLLLSSHLGDPDRRPLTTAQLRTLADRMLSMDRPAEDRGLRSSDLMALGYSRDFSQRVVSLLEEEAALVHYLQRGGKMGCRPITRVSPEYPLILRQRLGLDSPGCLWVKGDALLLNAPAIALVGSRELRKRTGGLRRKWAVRRRCRAWCWFPAMPGVQTVPLKMPALGRADRSSAWWLTS